MPLWVYILSYLFLYRESKESKRYRGSNWTRNWTGWIFQDRVIYLIKVEIIEFAQSIRGEKVNSRRLNGANEAYGGNESRKSHTRDITLFFQPETFSQVSISSAAPLTMDRVNTFFTCLDKKNFIQNFRIRILSLPLFWIHFFKILSLHLILIYLSIIFLRSSRRIYNFYIRLLFFIYYSFSLIFSISQWILLVWIPLI